MDNFNRIQVLGFKCQTQNCIMHDVPQERQMSGKRVWGLQLGVDINCDDCGEPMVYIRDSQRDKEKVE